MTAFDREKARAVLRPYVAGFGYAPSMVADEVLAALEACVLPVEVDGIVLTVDEAELAAAALRTYAHDLEPMSRYRASVAADLVDSNILAERLEAAT